jgi:hypothetical protein
MLALEAAFSTPTPIRSLWRMSFHSSVECGSSLLPFLYNESTNIKPSEFGITFTNSDPRRLLAVREASVTGRTPSGRLDKSRPNL